MVYVGGGKFEKTLNIKYACFLLAIILCLWQMAHWSMDGEISSHADSRCCSWLIENIFGITAGIMKYNE